MSPELLSDALRGTEQDGGLFQGLLGGEKKLHPCVGSGIVSLLIKVRRGGRVELLPCKNPYASDSVSALATSVDYPKDATLQAMMRHQFVEKTRETQAVNNEALFVKPKRKPPGSAVVAPSFDSAAQFDACNKFYYEEYKSSFQVDTRRFTNLQEMVIAGVNQKFYEDRV